GGEAALEPDPPRSSVRPGEMPANPRCRCPVTATVLRGSTVGVPREFVEALPRLCRSRLTAEVTSEEGRASDISCGGGVREDPPFVPIAELRHRTSKGTDRN